MSFKPIVYGLVDPLEPDCIRYVGVATVKRRPWVHKQEAYLEYRNHKRNWIRKILDEERMYDVKVLEEFPTGTLKSVLHDAEIIHIARLRAEGHDLTNQTNGGDGIFAWTDEMRDHASVVHKATWESPEFRAKMSIALQAQWNDPEFCDRHVERCLAKWKDPEYREKQTAAFKIAANDPERRAKHSAAMKIINNEPEYKARTSDTMVLNWSKPEYRKMILESRKEGQKRRYSVTENAVKTSIALSKSLNQGISIEKQILNTGQRIKVHTRLLDGRKGSEQAARSQMIVDHLNQRLTELQKQLQEQLNGSSS